MELTQENFRFLPELPVTGVSKGVIYYVFSGRNAWHSTWITRYSAGCMHTTLESAKKYAEKRRVRGTVFYIKQLPCLIIRSNNKCVLITEINNDNPLCQYSPNATTSHVAYGLQKIENALDNYMKIGTPLNGLVLSFRPDSRFWNARPSTEDSVIILSSENSVLPVEKSNTDHLLAYKSYSHGGNYYLGWSKSDSVIKRCAILKLYKIFKPNKPKKKAQRSS